MVQMATLVTDDGTEIHWEERGHGPLVVVMSHTFAYPGVLEGLLADLASDHRVVTYDPRGTGKSTRRGPYDLATDKTDLEALTEELGGAAAALAWGESGHRAILLAADRPDLLPTVVVMGSGGGVVSPDESASAEGLAGSEAVRTAFAEMLSTNYRAGLRWRISSTSPQLSDDEVRERVERGVEYCSEEAAVERSRYFSHNEETAPRARELGDRLWVIQFPTTWHPRETIDMVRERLPRAHVYELEEDEGPLSRPEIAASIVRHAVDLNRARK
jgi:pimeloyl-ACP methyl ester carboxylesterase